jgi:hypothetical protein
MVDLKKLKASLSYLVKFKGIPRSVQLIAIAQRIEARGMAWNIYTYNTRIICIAFIVVMLCLFFISETVLLAQEEESLSDVLDKVLKRVTRVSLYLDSHADCTVSQLQKFESAMQHIYAELLSMHAESASDADKLEFCFHKLSQLLIRIADRLARAR